MKAARIGRPLAALVVVLSMLAGATSQLPAAFGLTQHDPDAPVIDAAVWISIGILWLAVTLRARGSVTELWRLPSRLFRGGVGVGAAEIVLGRGIALVDTGAAPAFLVSALESALYALGVVALASLAAFASARSLLRPALVGTRPPLGARDIGLRTRILVATMGASFATGGILLNVLIDFDATPPAQLASFLATAGVLVLASALIGWLVGEDASQSVNGVTQRMRELARSERTAPTEVPVIAADEVGDLIVAANELERRVRREEAIAAATTERERIARELHDGVAKSVSVLSLEIASVAARAPDELQPRLARTEHLARVLAEELRAIVHEFRTRTEDEPFAETLRRTVRGHGSAALETEGDLDRVGGLARFEVLRVLDEALENAERHANGTGTHARLAVDDSALHLVVEDDGRGIGPIAWTELASQGHFGLLGMRERAALLDADLRLEARSGGGTRVSLDVPLDGGGT